ncbi:hypothetical protein [Haloplanus pelagicus]|uniref:hypothetical protein n=1 Tax=Haloplanus pelagicus TaxID=2949995 RepID=UPI00204183E9|nr:hypothetical protein [Haloplanus sp. HW8-1]
MTYEVAEDAPERTRREVEQLHELAVNTFGYATDHVLFTAHGDGTISGRIALPAGRPYDDTDDDRERTTLHDRIARRFQDNNDTDPDPPAVCAPITPDAPSANIPDEAQASV